MKKTAKKESKSKVAIISTLVFLILGITAFVLGYGLTDGWASVLAWFGSRWAIYIYILIGFLALIVVWLWARTKIGE